MPRKTVFMWIQKTFHFFGSLKIVLPLLVLYTLITAVVTMLPARDIDVFHSTWYLSLLGLLGFCLLSTTLDRLPSILRNKGQAALIGITLTHLGILVLIGAYIYGALAEFRHKLRVIENEMLVVPELPFVLRLDRLVIEDYPKDAFGHLNLAMMPKKRQDSELSFYKQGELYARGVASPGQPLVIDGITLLPSQKNFGWYFELLITDPRGREKIIPIRPWAPPLINLGEIPVMAHSIATGEKRFVRLFTFQDGSREMLGELSENKSLKISGYDVSLGEQKRYTGLVAYSRPQTPLLIVGCFITLAGLIWHFYHRSKTQTWDNSRRARNA